MFVWLMALLHFLPYFVEPPQSRDLQAFFWPAWTFTRHAVWQGHFPLWNPYFGCGEPWSANFQTGLFYPLSLLFYLFPFDRVLVWYSWIVAGLSGSAALWLLEVMGMSSLGALAGALVWQMSGFFAVHQEHLPIASSLPWIPAWMATQIQAQRTREPRWIALGGLACGCLLLAGNPQIALMAGLMVLVWVDWRQPLRAGGILILGLLVSAIQVWPALAYQSHGLRSAGTSAAFSLSFSLLPSQILGLFLPDLYRLGGVESNPTPYTAYYFGAGATVLVLLACTRRSCWEQPHFVKAGLLVVIGLVLALGGSTPVYPALLTVVHFLGLFRAPARFVLVCTLGMALLTAMGLQGLAPRWQRAVIVLMSLELLWLGQNFLAQGEYRTPPVLTALAQLPGPFRIQFSEADFLDVNSGATAGLANITTYDPMETREYVEYLLFNELQHLPEQTWFDQVKIYNAVYVDRMNTPMVRLLNLRWRIVDGRAVPYPGLPRFFLVGTQRVIPSLEETLLAMRAFDPEHEVLLDRGCPPLQPPGQGHIEIQNFAPDDLAVSVQTDKPALLVDSDLYFPDWHADLDGQAVDMYRADGIFRGIYVPAGQHHLSMHFRPRLFYISAAVSGFTVLGCLSFICVSSRRTRRLAGKSEHDVP